MQKESFKMVPPCNSLPKNILMKQLRFISAFVFIFFCFSVKAQTKTKQNAPLTKGYYSIDNNAAKLPPGERVEAKKGNTNQGQNKGYYSIGKNYKKAKAPMVIENRKRVQKAPQVKKGYYSIGNNAQK